MGTFDNLKGKVGDLVDGNSDKISQGVDKAGELIDSKTGGKHADQIATGREKLEDSLDGLDGRDDDFPNTRQSGGTDRPNRNAEGPGRRCAPAGA